MYSHLAETLSQKLKLLNLYGEVTRPPAGGKLAPRGYTGKFLRFACHRLITADSQTRIANSRH